MILIYFNKLELFCLLIYNTRATAVAVVEYRKFQPQCVRDDTKHPTRWVGVRRIY